MGRRVTSVSVGCANGFSSRSSAILALQSFSQVSCLNKRAPTIRMRASSVSFYAFTCNAKTPCCRFNSVLPSSAFLLNASKLNFQLARRVSSVCRSISFFVSAYYRSLRLSSVPTVLVSNVWIWFHGPFDVPQANFCPSPASESAQ